MRTTLTLDDDIAAALDELTRLQPKLSFKAVVNEVLRTGLQARRETQEIEPFRVRARSMGLNKNLNYDKISTLIEELEGPTHS